jgi:hypothetical protein
MIETLFFDEFESTKTDLSKIQNQFKLPIQYNSSVKSIQPTVQQDLETDKITKLLYGETKYNTLIDTLSKYYTTDTKFLKEHQIYLENTGKHGHDLQPTSDIGLREKWKEIMEHPNIKEQYFYLEWKHLDRFNYNSSVLLGLSMMNIGGPIISLLSPIFIFLIVPFIVLRYFCGTSHTSRELYDSLFRSNMNPLHRYMSLISGDVPFNEKVKTMTMLVFYLISFYQNILLCIRFYKNIFEIKSFIYESKTMFMNAGKQIQMIVQQTENLYAFTEFRKSLMDTQNKINNMIQDTRFNCVTTENFTPFQLASVGKYMSLFYSLRNDEHIQKLYMYCFELNEYVYHLCHLIGHTTKNALQVCNFTSKKKKLNLVDAFHPVFINADKVTTNTIRLDKNVIITGPNASGKTTTLKSVLYNILLSQQIGMGCYNKSTKVCIYDEFFSYLNIPDTSDRDSLFESEAKRCLSFINKIKQTQDNNYFLIFDEMYSGTNPNEASISGLCFINYLSKMNVTFMITTHYYDMCNAKRLSKRVVNMCMHTSRNDANQIQYSYRLQDGISYEKGGIEVLKRLCYPDEIIKEIYKMENENTSHITKRSSSSSKRESSKVITYDMISNVARL